MGVEIERKFLVKRDRWNPAIAGTRYCQGYVTSGKGRTVRVRIAGDQGFLTLKGPTRGLSRAEFEYPIPLADAEELLNTLCDRPLIEKIRYKINHAGLLWEVDEFLGENQGLLMAEVELTDAQQSVTLPDWVGQEVSGDRRYFNAYLVRHPFQSWGNSKFPNPTGAFRSLSRFLSK
jgi:adenylate cyclase